LEKKEQYNEAISKLKSLYDELESGRMDLDALSGKVKEASRLINICKDKLYKVDEDLKKTIEEI
jgi:exodeoxyribonuclease VII small subunit